MRAATEGSLPPVIPEGNLVEGLGREVRQGSPGELMVESSPFRQRRQPCKTNKEMSDEAADAATLTYLLTLLNDWNKKKLTQNHKKLHYSVIQNKCITKTINNILHPRTTSPLSLYDTNGNLTSDPNAMCQSMGEFLISLGGPPSFDIDTSFIDKVMTNSPKLPGDAPHSDFTRQFFDHLLSMPNRTPPLVLMTPLSTSSLLSLVTYNPLFTTCALPSLPLISPSTGLKPKVFSFIKKETHTYP